MTNEKFLTLPLLTPLEKNLGAATDDGDPSRGAHNGDSTTVRELNSRYYKIIVKWTLTLKA